MMYFISSMFLPLFFLMTTYCYSTEFEVESFNYSENPFELLEPALGKEKLFPEKFYDKLDEISRQLDADIEKYFKKMRTTFDKYTPEQYCHVVYSLINAIHTKGDIHTARFINSLLKYAKIAAMFNIAVYARIYEQLEIYKFIVAYSPKNPLDKSNNSENIDILLQIKNTVVKNISHYEELIKNSNLPLFMMMPEGFAIAKIKDAKYQKNTEYFDYYDFIKNKQILNIYSLRINSLKKILIEIDKILAAKPAEVNK